MFPEWIVFVVIALQKVDNHLRIATRIETISPHFLTRALIFWQGKLIERPHHPTLIVGAYQYNSETNDHINPTYRGCILDHFVRCHVESQTSISQIGTTGQKISTIRSDGRWKRWCYLATIYHCTGHTERIYITCCLGWKNQSHWSNDDFREMGCWFRRTTTQSPRWRCDHRNWGENVGKLHSSSSLT